jgi:SAM-dependent methyltransferase
MANQKCSAECDIFDFMAREVGMSVLHPGGLWATERMAQMCRVSHDSRVLDIACGKGITAAHLARKTGCRVTGVDIDENFIRQAERLAKNEGQAERVEFRQASALNLPFSDNEYNVTLSQAFLILIDDKQRAIREAVRVTKPGGHIAWLELSFTKKPPQSLFDAANSSACAFCIKNVLIFEEWERLFRKNGMEDLQVAAGEMGTRRRWMFKDEGFSNAVRVISRWLFVSRIRKRMKSIMDFFNDHAEYIRYGIYVGRKPS